MFHKKTLLLCYVVAASIHAQAESDLTAPKQENFSAQEPLTFKPFTGEIHGSKVRLRVSPSLDAHVIRETAQGELFAVTGENQEYYAVEPPKGTKGYVFRTFILDGIVEGERVNIRLYPDMESPVVGQLNRGDRVEAAVSDVNNKWLEIDLPHTCNFYIAKEYIDRKGTIELIAALEKTRQEAAHYLSAASLFAQAELQKPFDEIDWDHIQEKFTFISDRYQDCPKIPEQIQEASTLLHDLYIQKKVAFLEGKIQPIRGLNAEAESLDKLAKIGNEIHKPCDNYTSETALAISKTLGLATSFESGPVTDKMLLWQPLEESLYHLWAMTHGEQSMEEFYMQEAEEAVTLTGIVEPYNRPVKNRPGDFLLKNENVPVAFLYSTRINLEKLVGQKITVMATPRPNHHFAFPAYYVIAIE